MAAEAFSAASVSAVADINCIGCRICSFPRQGLLYSCQDCLAGGCSSAYGIYRALRCNNGWEKFFNSSICNKGGFAVLHNFNLSDLAARYCDFNDQLAAKAFSAASVSAVTDINCICCAGCCLSCFFP